MDEIIESDKLWRKLKYQADGLRRDLGLLGKEIAQKKKANKDDPCEEELKKKKEIELSIVEADNIEKAQNLATLSKIKLIGNIVHEKVPVSDNEANNAVLRTWGEKPDLEIDGETPGKAHHNQILYMIDGYEQKKGCQIAGNRGFFLKGYGTLLNMALQQYGMQFLHKKGYLPIQPPYFMKKAIMAETCQLSDFDEQLYRISVTHRNEGKKEEEEVKDKDKKEEDEFYMIATSEQPISAFHRGDWMDPKSLPIKYAGISTCFRKEAGSGGKQNWGVYRVHQFEKIEQFVYSPPDKSWDLFEDMISVAEEFM